MKRLVPFATALALSACAPQAPGSPTDKAFQAGYSCARSAVPEVFHACLDACEAAYPGDNREFDCKRGVAKRVMQ